MAGLRAFLGSAFPQIAPASRRGRGRKHIKCLIPRAGSTGDPILQAQGPLVCSLLFRLLSLSCSDEGRGKLGGSCVRTPACPPAVVQDYLQSTGKVTGHLEDAVRSTPEQDLGLGGHYSPFRAFSKEGIPFFTAGAEKTSGWLPSHLPGGESRL